MITFMFGARAAKRASAAWWAAANGSSKRASCFAAFCPGVIQCQARLATIVFPHRRPPDVHAFDARRQRPGLCQDAGQYAELAGGRQGPCRSQAFLNRRLPDVAAGARHAAPRQADPDLQRRRQGLRGSPNGPGGTEVRRQRGHAGRTGGAPAQDARLRAVGAGRSLRGQRGPRDHHPAPRGRALAFRRPELSAPFRPAQLLFPCHDDLRAAAPRGCATRQG
mmetsp:Transcript_39182/g.92019  ORF Transcript_39182/g.92019 Transcript_39182/m.92019 type:complete len:222 (+) Transcript_39182:2151-2816(+)